ncbi:methionine/alanine import family NSS transporter small subunit [Microbacterium invictum]|uniref:Methionine/alanine importer small subunit n=1 Tax=Microbacterium invictum TaxID=515415 RepID=A0AA40SM05_9MICO|nr:MULTISPECIES: methionine/alanine import family NSS transporter small subunit [Microbacterium]MBB4138682.1 hypothetical protein [Microbacterium invictum]
MTAIAIVFLIVSIVLVWGGLVVSAVMLRRQSEVDRYPPGGVDDHREDVGIIEHDT